MASVTVPTTTILKVEFNSDPELSNVVLQGAAPGGKNLLIAGVPSAIGSALAIFEFAGLRTLYAEYKNPVTVPDGAGGNFVQGDYAGRIEIRKP
jgi:predicted NAD/FAD-dependent oxidoreductase